MNNYFVFFMVFCSFNVYSAALGKLPKNTDKYLRDLYLNPQTAKPAGHVDHNRAVEFCHSVGMSEDDARRKLLEMSGNGHCNMVEFKRNFTAFRDEYEAKRQAPQRQQEKNQKLDQEQRATEQRVCQSLLINFTTIKDKYDARKQTLLRQQQQEEFEKLNQEQIAREQRKRDSQFWSRELDQRCDAEVASLTFCYPRILAMENAVRNQFK